MKSKIAFEFSLERFLEMTENYYCYMWTLTVPDKDYDVQNFRQYNRRFSLFFQSCKRQYPDFHSLRVYEFGGKNNRLHCHFLTLKRYDVSDFRSISMKQNLGRIHVVRIPKNQSFYLAKYLTKRHDFHVKNMRLWGSINFNNNKVKNVILHSPKAVFFRYVFSVNTDLTKVQRFKILSRVNCFLARPENFNFLESHTAYLSYKIMKCEGVFDL